MVNKRSKEEIKNFMCNSIKRIKFLEFNKISVKLTL